MNEIEKMYENAEIEPITDCGHGCNIIGLTKNCENCPYADEITYPPFTAEKQLDLIKNISPAYPLNYHIKCFQGYSFEEGLAKCINNLWQYLTEKEKQQIKEILK